MKTTTEKIIELYKRRMEAEQLKTRADVLAFESKALVKLGHRLKEHEIVEQNQILTRLSQISDEMKGISKKMKQLHEESENRKSELGNPFGRGEKFHNN